MSKINNKNNTLTMSQNRLMVTKRNGQQVPVSFDKVLNRIEKQCYKLEMDYIKPFDIAKKVLNGIYDGVTTSELDSLATETAASLTTHHPDYAKLAARLAISTLHKETEKSFSKTVEKLFKYIHPRTGKHSPLVSEEFLATVRLHADVLDAAIIHSRDYNFDYFGFKTLEKSYLLKLNGKIAERPQFMIMRTAIAIHKNDMGEVMKTYELMSEGFFTHATPTLFNSGTPRQQLSSCYLLRMQDDSIEGIMETLRESALISKNAGGIGIAASNIRATGSYIAGTNGDSKGLIPFLQMFNMTARAVDQGGNKRKGAFAIYLEPWHGDIMEFLDLRKNHGKEELRARDLFLGVWMPDLFMQRVEQDLDWSLMCPNECPGLDDCYGEEFITLYEKYESEGKYMKKVKARDVWYKILEAQIETGFPYILYKDSANKKSNQKNIGILRTSNLCLAGDTIVDVEYIFGESTERGSLALSVLDKLYKDLKSLTPEIDKRGLTEVRVLSYNNSKAEYKAIQASALTNQSAKVMRITDEATGKTITCTPDHQVFTANRGYVMAKDLKEDDTLVVN